MVIKERHPAPKVISAKDIRSRLGEVINQVAYGRQPYLITRHDKPAVIMLSVEDYEDLLDAVDTMLEQMDPEFQKSLNQGMTAFQAGRGATLGTVEEIKQFVSRLK